MIQIIKNKRYDTDTATEIDEWWNGLGGNDFGNCRETLYQTEKGAYFLYGRGGPMSTYRERSGNMWCGGSTIRPLTNEEAYQWCEEHGLTETIEAHFSDTVEDA